MHGDKDSFVNIEYSKKANDVSNNSELFVINKGTHGFFLGGWKEAMNCTNSFFKKKFV